MKKKNELATLVAPFVTRLSPLNTQFSCALWLGWCGEQCSRSLIPIFALTIFDNISIGVNFFPNREKFGGCYVYGPFGIFAI